MNPGIRIHLFRGEKQGGQAAKFALGIKIRDCFFHGSKTLAILFTTSSFPCGADQLTIKTKHYEKITDPVFCNQPFCGL